MIMMIMMVHQPFVMTIQPWRQVKKRSPTMTQSRQRVSLSTAKTIASIPPQATVSRLMMRNLNMNPNMQPVMESQTMRNLP